ncbi:MAG: site-specific DNA-methyltransferase [Candidatus Hatepunaea meridiana]|nr:site-specific DNA-methyltransferase [Candidatus Hatepunaea meridiana]
MPTLQFKGRSVVWNHHLGVPYRELIPCPEKSRTDKLSLHDNLIIHGDNLHALKALLPTYAGKVKCIYIDPPYNTGNEGWKYNDNVNSPLMKEWLGKEVGIDDEERHDKWLCMMTPRLQILKELLREDGFLFISIGDDESLHLLNILNDIFLETNFVANFIWKSRKSSQNDIDLSLSHNYVLCYAKNRSIAKLNVLGADQSKFSNPDNDPRGDWIADPMDAPGIRENLNYEIGNPLTRETYFPPQGRHWRFTEQKYTKAVRENRIVFGKKGITKPQFKRFWTEAMQKGKVTFTVWDEIETATDASKTLMAIFDGAKVFETPKPVSLIERVLRLSSNGDSIILDSFAGSGASAHAILSLNNEDGGNRKFILVECEDYADNITAERVRRVIKGVPSAKKPQLRDGLGGSFSYFELGEPIEIHSLLSGENLPSFEELARYVFFTATGEEIDLKKIDRKSYYIGSAREYDVYMIYKPEFEFLRKSALTLDYAKSLPPHKLRTRVVFAPARYLSQDFMREYRVEFCQLPYELYRGLK